MCHQNLIRWLLREVDFPDQPGAVGGDQKPIKEYTNQVVNGNEKNMIE